MQPVVPEYLRPLVLALGQRPLDRAETNSLADLCHDLALIAVRMRISSALLHYRFKFDCHNDIAYDCIADLFRQDEKGLLVQFKAFFDALDIRQCSEEELLVHLRRLVFSRVNHGLFRILQEADPELGRIIRNIKLAVQGLPAFALIERFGESCLAPLSGDTLEHLPVPETDELARAMAETRPLPAHIPGFLAAIALYLRQQETRSRIVPVVRLALAIRSLYGSEGAREDGGAIEDRWTAEDVERVLRDVLSSLCRRATARYVERQSLGAELVDAYLRVIHDHLRERYVGDDGDRRSLFERLQQYQPETDRRAYATTHRTRIEYLLKIATREADRQLRAGLR